MRVLRGTRIGRRAALARPAGALRSGTSIGRAVRAGALRAARSDADAVAPARAQLANGGGKRRLVASAPRRGTRATGVAAASVFRAA